MKKLTKIASIFLTISMLMSFASIVFANGIEIPTIQIRDNPFSTLGGTILGFIQWFGYIFAVGMLLYIGIKYMMSSANEKADLKKGSINYVIGAVLVFGASTLVGWIGQAVNSNLGTE